VKIENHCFKYKGNRNYIHGTDIYNAIMDCIDNENIKNIRFSIHDFIWKNNCKIFLYNDNEKLKKNFPVRCSMQVNRNALKVGLMEEDLFESKKLRYNYDEDQIIKLCNFDYERVYIEQESPYSFIETIVAMKKEMLSRLFPETIGKWAFTQLHLTHNFQGTKKLEIKIKAKLGFHLIKSDIAHENNKIGTIFFSLVQK